MSAPAYIWRKLTPKQRDELLEWRQRQGLPWHRPPHRASEKTRYHLTAACFEHRPYIGSNCDRIQQFCRSFLDVLAQRNVLIHAWCVLPNHYHALIDTSDILAVLTDVARMHGRLSFEWNAEDGVRGRQVWCGAVERYMRNDAHFWATMNYIHHNPVHHRYVERWQDWPFSSARNYLAEVTEPEATRIWKQYPILEYGKGWDDPEV